MNNKNIQLEKLGDLHLISLVKQGNKQAFDEIVKRHHQKLYQTALVILEDNHDAEQITRESIRKAYQTLSEIKEDSLLLTWLCRILINEACKKYHSNHHKQNTPAANTCSPLN